MVNLPPLHSQVLWFSVVKRVKHGNYFCDSEEAFVQRQPSIEVMRVCPDIRREKCEYDENPKFRFLQFALDTRYPEEVRGRVFRWSEPRYKFRANSPQLRAWESRTAGEELGRFVGKPKNWAKTFPYKTALKRNIRLHKKLPLSKVFLDSGSSSLQMLWKVLFSISICKGIQLLQSQKSLC